VAERGSTRAMKIKIGTVRIEPPAPSKPSTSPTNAAGTSARYTRYAGSREMGSLASFQAIMPPVSTRVLKPFCARKPAA